MLFLKKEMGILQSPPSVRTSGRPSFCPSVTLSPPNPFRRNPTKFSVLVVHMNWARNSTLFWPSPWGPGEGPKGQISLNVNNKVDFKYFKPNFVYLLTNEIYETYQTAFLFCRLGHAPGVGLGGLQGG